MQPPKAASSTSIIAVRFIPMFSPKPTAIRGSERPWFAFCIGPVPDILGRAAWELSTKPERLTQCLATCPALPLLASLTLFVAGPHAPVGGVRLAQHPGPHFPVRATPPRSGPSGSPGRPGPNRSLDQDRAVAAGHAPPLAFQPAAFHLAGPDNRLRLDLQVQQDPAASRSLVVSDGRTLSWHSRLAARSNRHPHGPGAC